MNILISLTESKMDRHMSIVYLNPWRCRTPSRACDKNYSKSSLETSKVYRTLQSFLTTAKGVNHVVGSMTKPFHQCHSWNMNDAVKPCPRNSNEIAGFCRYLHEQIIEECLNSWANWVKTIRITISFKQVIPGGFSSDINILCFIPLRSSFICVKTTQIRTDENMIKN